MADDHVLQPVEGIDETEIKDTGIHTTLKENLTDSHFQREQKPVEPLPQDHHDDHIPPPARFIRRRIQSPIYTPHFNYTDTAFFSGLLIVTIAAFATRLYKLNDPPHVA